MEMGYLVIHLLTAAVLFTIFLTQTVLLNLTLITYYHDSPYTYLWFLADFFSLLTMAFDSYMAYKWHQIRRRNERRLLTGKSYELSYAVVPANDKAVCQSRPHSRFSQRSNTSSSSSTSEFNWPTNTAWFKRLTKVPMTYLAWLLYSVLLVAKITTIFKAGIPQGFSHEPFLGPQSIKICIGLAAIVYSLLVEAHKDTYDDPVRNAYVNSLSMGIAVEILDSVSFLAILIGSQSGLIYSFEFENVVLALSSVNLMLPGIALYKLSASEFGRQYSVPLEAVYKVLHLVLVNGSYLGVRVYLWVFLQPDTSIFIIKNIYAVLVFLRDIPTDINAIQVWFLSSRRLKRVSPEGGDALEESGRGTTAQSMEMHERPRDLEEEGGAGDVRLDAEDRNTERYLDAIILNAAKVHVTEIGEGELGGRCRVRGLNTYELGSEERVRLVREAVYARPSRVFIVECGPVPGRTGVDLYESQSISSEEEAAAAAGENQV